MDWEKFCSLSKHDNYSYVAEKYNDILNKYWKIAKKDPDHVRAMFLQACDADRNMKFVFLDYLAYAREKNESHPITCNEVLRFIARAKYEFELIGGTGKLHN